ncbi:MAG TPA: regulatory protein RecX [Candidatus Saccharimonadales bacterium]|nr:regulatory protein RecX [Candidatus Saccharimonadales bacterium]
MSEAYERTREAALRILDRRRRTRAELERKLKEKGFEGPDIAAVCDRLEEVKILDDLEYARLYLEGRRARPRGTRLLLQELRGKGVPEATARRALEELEAHGERGTAERERAVALARQSARKVAGLPPREARNKLFQALARRGFDLDTIEAAVREVLPGR